MGNSTLGCPCVRDSVRSPRVQAGEARGSVGEATSSPERFQCDWAGTVASSQVARSSEDAGLRQSTSSTAPPASSLPEELHPMKDAPIAETRWTEVGSVLCSVLEPLFRGQGKGRLFLDTLSSTSAHASWCLSALPPEATLVSIRRNTLEGCTETQDPRHRIVRSFDEMRQHFGNRCIDVAWLDLGSLNAEYLGGSKASECCIIAEWLSKVPAGQLAWVFDSYGISYDPFLCERFAEVLVTSRGDQGPYDSPEKLEKVVEELIEDFREEWPNFSATWLWQAARSFLARTTEVLRSHLEETINHLKMQGCCVVACVKRWEMDAVRDFLADYESPKVGCASAEAVPVIYKQLGSGAGFTVELHQSPIQCLQRNVIFVLKKVALPPEAMVPSSHIDNDNIIATDAGKSHISFELREPPTPLFSAAQGQLATQKPTAVASNNNNNNNNNSNSDASPAKAASASLEGPSAKAKKTDLATEEAQSSQKEEEKAKKAAKSKKKKRSGDRDADADADLPTSELEARRTAPEFGLGTISELEPGTSLGKSEDLAVQESKEKQHDDEDEAWPEADLKKLEELKEQLKDRKAAHRQNGLSLSATQKQPDVKQLADEINSLFKRGAAYHAKVEDRVVARSHVPVLLKEGVEALLANGNDGLFVDGTFGRGGHSRAILSALGPKGRLKAFDVDPSAIREGQRLMSEDSRFEIIHGPFGDVATAITDPIKGLLVDTGPSTPQLVDCSRGFSFNPKQNGPLDLRMNQRCGMPAAEWLQTVDAGQLAWVLKHCGHSLSDKLALRLAVGILSWQESRGPFTSTCQFAAALDEIMPDFAFSHPRLSLPQIVFAGLRTFLNQEQQQLRALLEAAFETLEIHGRLVLITFAKWEILAIRRFVREHQEPTADCLAFLPSARLAELYPGIRFSYSVRRVSAAARPSFEEQSANRRSKSAVLHVLEKVPCNWPKFPGMVSLSSVPEERLVCPESCLSQPQV